MNNPGISLATRLTRTGRPLTAQAAVDADEFAEQLGGTTPVAADVTFLDVPVDGALRLYAPQPANGRE